MFSIYARRIGKLHLVTYGLLGNQLLYSIYLFARPNVFDEELKLN